MSRSQLRQFLVKPGMYIPRETYYAFVSFLEGFDFASGGSALRGFHEWLVERYGVARDLHYSASVLDLLGFPWPATMTPEREKLAIERLRALLEEFFEATRDSRQNELMGSE